MNKLNNLFILHLYNNNNIYRLKQKTKKKSYFLENDHFQSKSFTTLSLN